MRTETVVKFFRTRKAIAEFLQISPSAVSRWGDIVPEGSAYKLQVLTKNKLRVDPNCYEPSQKRAA